MTHRTADLIPFPRPKVVAIDWLLAERSKCANGMPGHPPCRSTAELEALLRARADVTAAREGV